MVCCKFMFTFPERHLLDSFKKALVLRCLLMLLFIGLALPGSAQTEISLTGGVSLPAGAFQKAQIERDNYGLASSGYQIALEGRFGSSTTGFRLSMGYTGNPVNKGAFLTAVQQSVPYNANNWQVAAQSYDNLHLMLGPDIRFKKGIVNGYLNALVGGMYTRLPRIKAVASVGDGQRYQQIRSAANDVAPGFSINSGLRLEVSKYVSLYVNLGYYGAEQNFKAVDKQVVTPNNGPNQRKRFKQDYQVSVSYFVVKTGVGVNFD